VIRTHRFSSQTAIILGSMAALTILAWAYLLHLDRQMSEAMAYEIQMADMGMSMHAPWTIADGWFTFGMWAVMMFGMMAPSAAPILLLAAKSRVSANPAGTRWMPLFFGAGYMLVWVGFSAIAALVQWILHDAALLSPMMSAASPRVGGAILVGAGLYQLTPLKHACLKHCQRPLDFLMAHWRSGRAGALRMGAHHGVYCLGCCWALMGVLFVVGVMNLAWVAALAVFVLIEKLAPAAIVISRIAGAAIVVAGLIKFVLNA
jgi:predicted metal-binding membrane protein